MKTLYLQCNMGISGDMLAGALYELLEERDTFLKTANALLPRVSVRAVPCEKQGIRGTHLAVLVDGAEEPQGMAGHHHGEAHRHSHGEDAHHHHAHHHTSLAHIQQILAALPVSDRVRQRAAQVYDRLAQAESQAHGCPVEQIHFHEVGELDAVADITLACLALEQLGADQVICSPICTGFGQVRCAHGVLPVPAPATALLLKGLPCYAGPVEGELTTPTGAALAGMLADRFGQMPVMRVERLGYGMGTKDFPAANCLRAFLGETEEETDQVTELVCSVDDMTPEALAYASERLMELGALDVSILPALMKKGRPGHLLTVLARPAEEQLLARALLRETTTNGLRFRRCSRMVLTPSIETAETSLGPVRVKRAQDQGTIHTKPEYEDVAAIARREGLPFVHVSEQISREL